MPEQIGGEKQKREGMFFLLFSGLLTSSYVVPERR